MSTETFPVSLSWDSISTIDYFYFFQFDENKDGFLFPEEVLEALESVNSNLLSDSHINYIYRVSSTLPACVLFHIDQTWLYSRFSIECGMQFRICFGPVLLRHDQAPVCQPIRNENQNVTSLARTRLPALDGIYMELV